MGAKLGPLALDLAVYVRAGVLRLAGEMVVDCTPVIGYLHRGIEKILEHRPILGGIRYMDNADYLSPMLNEIAYAGAVEQLMGIEPPRRAQYVRLLVGELQRIASHLVGSGSYINDLGTTTPLLWTFRDREGIMALFEALGGSRFNVNYMLVNSPPCGQVWPSNMGNCPQS